MRAWQVVKAGEPKEALSLDEVDAPEPGPGLLRIRVAACGVGLPDLFMCRGSYALTPELPFTPGQELVGTVTAVGEQCEASVGQRVMAVSAFFLRRGGFAQEALALDDFAFLAPSAMSDAECAGFVIPYHTAYVGLVRRARLEPGETLLVLGGAGGTGSAAIQLGKALGAHVITTAGGDEKSTFCRKLGADDVIDYQREDIAEFVRDATAGQGADVIYDPVGGDVFDKSTKCIAWEGRLLVIGFASGRIPEMAANRILLKNIAIVGLHWGNYFVRNGELIRSTHEVLCEMYDKKTIAPIVYRKYPLAELPDALAALESRESYGKVVVSLT
jgi:NADPH2:quinone reductase